MYKKILVPLSGTKNDEAMLKHVLELAKLAGASVMLIMMHRVIKSDDPFMEKIQMEVGSEGHRLKQKAETYLPELEETLGRHGIDVTAEFLVVEGAEADEIVAYAVEKGCDLIALSNRERGGVGSWFFSNLEEKVKRRSSLPLLLVAQPKE